MGMTKLGVSARAYARILRVSKIIDKLESSENILCTTDFLVCEPNILAEHKWIAKLY